jgi:hypothetical protein
MNKRVKYSAGPIGKVRVVPDFLPAPDELAFREEGVKVTLSLTKRSVDFFKGQAKKYRTPYQAMIRRLLDHYAQHHSTPASR